MKTVSQARTRAQAVVICAFVAAIVGCNSDSGTKDAGDYCSDTCDVFLACPRCQDVDPSNMIPDDIDGCITFPNYNSIQITNLEGLRTFCIGMCNEVIGEVSAVSGDCADALADFWQCNAETAVCDTLEPLPFIEDTGGVFLPDFTDCDAEAATAADICADQVP